MSGQDRVCKNCGTIVPVGMRNCPKCNRLFIDSSRERLYSSEDKPPAPKAAGNKRRPEKKGATEAAPLPAATADSDQKASMDTAGESEGGAKTDSYYGVAPLPPPENGSGTSTTGPTSTAGSSGGGGGGCHICAVLFIVISTIIQLAVLVI
jgi:hypothetical protein